MLAELTLKLASMLEDLGVFASVHTMPAETVVHPSAHIWLVEDVEILDKPEVARRLRWQVQVASYEKDPTANILGLVDAVRECFAGKTLLIPGPNELSVPKIIMMARESLEDPYIYLILVQLTAYPNTFTLT